MKTSLQQAFELFTGKKDSYRDFSIPFQIDLFTYATESHIAIRTESKNIDFIIPEYTGQKKPACQNLNWELNNLRPFTADRIKIESFMTQDEAVQVGVEEECGECAGIGQVEWTYGRHTMDADCPVCDGDGISTPARYKKTGNKTFETYSYIKINGYNFNMRFIYILFKLKDLLGAEIFIADFIGNMGKFKVGDCEIVVMKVDGGDENTLYSVES
jgi:hypothetical protein